MEQDLCIPDNRFYPVFPKLVVIGYAVTTGDKHGIVYLYHDSRVSFTVGCRSMDFTLVENNLMDDVFNIEMKVSHRKHA